MNLLEILSKELEGKNLTNLEKVRYIYYRVCQIFSYDARYNYACICDDLELSEEIRNKKIDIKNVTDTILICQVLSKVIGDLITSITGLKTDVLSNGNHAYLTCNIDGNIYKLDPLSNLRQRTTYGLDLMAVKMNFFATGMHIDEEDKKMPSLENLKDVDKSLGFTFLTRDDYLDRINLNTMGEDIAKLLSDSICSKTYADANSFISMLLEDENVRSQVCISPNYDLSRLYQMRDEYTYYLLAKGLSGNYEFSEITQDEYKGIEKVYSRH